MSLIEAISDVNNTFLSRRELTCNFAGLSGKLNKLEAIDMITKEFKLDGKLVVPMKLENHVGKSLVTGTFFVYEDENLAKSHVNPTIFKRLEKAKKAKEESEAQPEAAEATEAPEEAKEGAEESKDAAVEEKPAEEKKEEKAE
ncbi:MAG: hypothetical protein R3230_02425 [Nitrosopumilaceae archaeon]|nr:hypothetical protein [Nitrosopumilaceae archaeon]